MRKCIFFAISVLLLGLPVFAQDNSQWSAYLLDYTHQTLIHIGADGENQSYSLGIPEDGLISSVKISPDGSQVAYCYAYQSSPDVEWVYQLTIRDIDQEVNLLQKELWTGLLYNCALTAFNSDVLAVSLSSIADNENPTENWWELRLIDPVSGDLLGNIGSQTTTMPEFQVYDWVNVPISAKVLDLSREDVIFMAIFAFGGDAPLNYQAFEWNVSTNTIAELPAAFGYLASDYLPSTGDVVYAAYDESLPAASPQGPVPVSNIVRILDASGERTIYQTDEGSIYSTHFINNGQSVLVGINPADTAASGFITRYVVVNRDGSTATIDYEFLNQVFVASIPSGALIAHTPSSADFTSSTTEVFVLDSAFHLSAYPNLPELQSSNQTPPQLIWTSPSTVASDLVPFAGQ
jgi:hypothetical protein